MALDKLVDSAQLDSDLTSVADAIRAKGGTSAQLAFPTGFVDAVDAIETGGGGITADDLATAGLTGDIAMTVQAITKASAFYEQTGITKVSDPNLVTISGGNTFAYCSNLVQVDFPNLTTIAGDYTFRNCHKLGTVNFPKLKTATVRQFYQCGFGTNTQTTVLVLPALENTNGRNLEEFFRQGRFAAVDIGPGVDKMRGTFYACTCTAAILRRSASIVEALNAAAIDGLSNVWVPASLISAYEQATNWSARISGGYITLHPIEGSSYENAYADGTPIS